MNFYKYGTITLATVLIGGFLWLVLKPETAQGILGMVTFVAVIAILLLLYFLPSLVAHSEKHHNATAIFVLNLFLGWTFLGWVIALVWAFTKKS